MSRFWALPECPPRSLGDTAKCPQPHPMPTGEGAPDDRCPLAQVVAELQEAVTQGQGHEVPLAVCLLPVEEEQAGGATRQEHHL